MFSSLEIIMALSRTVFFQKKTHMEQYLHYGSHHFPTQKIWVLNTLATRALRISDDDHLDEEKAHLLKVFGENGYSRSQGLKDFMNASKGPRQKLMMDDVMVKFIYLLFKVLLTRSLGF